MLLTRAPLAAREQAPRAAVRLACVKHAASVQSGSSPELKEKDLSFVFRLPSKRELRKIFELGVVKLRRLSTVARRLTPSTLIGSLNLIFKELR